MQSHLGRSRLVKRTWSGIATLNFHPCALLVIATLLTEWKPPPPQCSAWTAQPSQNSHIIGAMVGQHGQTKFPGMSFWKRAIKPTDLKGDITFLLAESSHSKGDRAWEKLENLKQLPPPLPPPPPLVMMQSQNDLISTLSSDSLHTLWRAKREGLRWT